MSMSVDMMVTRDTRTHYDSGLAAAQKLMM